jgi:thiol-disulfide isomerase/thioredoxin
MNNLSDLTLSDIESDTLSPRDYLEKFSNKTEIVRNHEDYVPQKNILNQLEGLLTEKQEELNIFVMGASWCEDCTKHVPELIKIVETLDSQFVKAHILYGIKTNPLKKKEKYIWHEKHSPPEAMNPKFDLIAIPMFYLFNKQGKFLGRIEEEPKEDSTLEEDIYELLEMAFS